MKQKCIHLSDEDIILLNAIKKKYGLRSDSQVISYLLHKDELGNKEVAEAVRKELEEHYLSKERIRWGVQTAEQNSIVLMDAINSILWVMGVKNSYRVDELTHPVIKDSTEELKRKIAHFKQKSDERKRKEIG